MAEQGQLHHRRRRPRGVPRVSHAAGAAHVGRHHVVDVRLRGAGLRADRSRQRDEQQLVVRGHSRDEPLRRAAVAALRRVPARLDQSHEVRRRSVHRSRVLRLGRIPRSRARLHAHARQRRRRQRPAAGRAARRDRAQASPRHGLPRPGFRDHAARHALRLGRVGALHRGRVARARDRGLADGARSREGERRRADPARGVRSHGSDAAQAAGDARRRLAGRAANSGPRSAQPLQPLHAARARSRAGAGRRARASWCAVHASQLDRADRHDLAVAGQQREQRHRAFVRPSLLPQRDPAGQEDARRRSTCSRSSCWRIARS